MAVDSSVLIYEAVNEIADGPWRQASASSPSNGLIPAVEHARIIETTDMTHDTRRMVELIDFWYFENSCS